ncbi:hypothetical protein [Gillisia sp. JM1]|uniref:hypothetical protein n=1 Tax=Gillisia sp. JM1 TaxID=1283286 RepID=UPI0004243F60|nr:hypothetical protein [Gillisia sp. JM1]
MTIDTKTLTDAEGNRTKYNTTTNEIVSTIDKHGFIFDAEGNRTGHISNDEYIDGYFYE